MKKLSAGFTLIELVVTIVIIGILAATAVPKFANLTDQANLAVAEGVLGATFSQAVISLGENKGAAQTLSTIRDALDLSGDATSATIVGTGASNGCETGSDTVITVTLALQSTSATLSNNLCSG